MQLLLGIDVGTTALKVALFDEKGYLLAVATQEYSLETPRTNYVEVEANIYWESLKRGLEEINKKYLTSPRDQISVAISAQGETLICLDEQGQVLRKAIVWMDNRAEEEAQEMAAEFGNKQCYQVTGQVSFEPCWPAAKILWIKKNEPEIFAKVDKFLLVEDYLIYRMTGRFHTEGSLVCSSVYWDIINKCYWQDMLDFIGVVERQFPKVLESGVVVDVMHKKIANELGFECEVTVCTGALDQAAGAIGAGNIREGMFSETIGAALAICVPVSKPVFDQNQKMPLHYFAIPNTYMLHTFTTGGMTLRWYRDKFCSDEMAIENIGGGNAYDLISSEVSQVNPGCDGLVMLPHLSGSLAPDVNAKAKGVWFGFSLNHSKAHFARAIMESLGFILKRNLEALRAMNIEVAEVRSLGGGSKSKVWSQIKADINNVDLVTVKSEEAACLGAAILAGVGTGVFTSVADAVDRMIQVKDKFVANTKHQNTYNESYKMYCKLFEDLTECFDKTT